MAKGYSFAALVDVLYPVYKTSLGNGVNLDNFKSLDHVGVYVQAANVNAAGGSNYPAPVAGCLEVLPNTGGGVIQRYTVYTGDNNTYVRSIYEGTWSAWKRYLTDNIIYNAVYPVGISLVFAANVNPNAAFPGTTWVQVVDGRQIRAAENAAAIGTTGGSDTATLAVGNLPQHTHTTPDHTHQLPNHTHGLSHTHTATIADSVGHRHRVLSPQRAPDNQAGSMTVTYANYVCGSYHIPEVSGDDLAYSMQGTSVEASVGLSSYDGVHNHTVTVDWQTGQTSGTSATGITASGGGVTGGGSGTAAAVSTAGAWKKYGVWTRTA